MQIRAAVTGSDITTGGALTVGAQSDQKINAAALSVAAAVALGGTAVGVSGSGAAVLNRIATAPTAEITGKLASGVSAATVEVRADDESTINAASLAGALSVSGGKVGVAVALGVSVALNQVENAVTAKIGTGADVTATSSTVGDNIVVRAGSGTQNPEGTIDLSSQGTSADEIAAKLDDAAGTEQTTETQTINNEEVEVQIPVTADVQADNIVLAALKSAIGSALVTGDLRIAIIEDGQRWVAADESGNVWNVTRDGSTFKSQRVTINAISTAVSVGASFGAKAIAISAAGAFGMNGVLTNVDAGITGATVTTNAGNIKVLADSQSVINAAVLSASLSVAVGAVGVGVAIGAAVARNAIGASLIDGSAIAGTGGTYATITDSAINAADDVIVRATSDNSINSLVFAGGVAIAAGKIGVAVSGSGVYVENSIASTTSARIIGDVDDTTVAAVRGDNVEVTALNTSQINAVAATVSVAAALGKVGVAVSMGATVARNEIDGLTQAQILNSSQGGVQARSGDVTVQATDTSNIRAVSAAASLAVAGGLVSVGVALAGALAFNRIGAGVSATIDGSLVTATQGNVSVLATSDGRIDAINAASALSLAVGGVGVGVGVGASFVSNMIGYTYGNQWMPRTTDDTVDSGELTNGDTVRVLEGINAGRAFRYIGESGLTPNIDTNEDGDITTADRVPLKSVDFNNPELWEEIDLQKNAAAITAAVSGSDITTSGLLKVDAQSDQKINAASLSVAAALAVGGVAFGISASGSGVSNRIATNPNASISGKLSTGVSAGTVIVQADDESSINATSLAGALSFAAGSVGSAVSIGVSLAFNQVENAVTAKIDNNASVVATSAVAGDSILVRAGAGTQNAEKTLDLTSIGSSLATSIALDDAAGTEMTTQTNDDDKEVEVAVTQDVNDDNDTLSKLATALSAHYDVEGPLRISVIEDGSRWVVVDAAGTTWNIARNTSNAFVAERVTISALSGAMSIAASVGTGAYSVAGAGAFGQNVILSNVEAKIDGATVTANTGAIKVLADSQSVINSAVLSTALAVGVGGGGFGLALGVSVAQNYIGATPSNATNTANYGQTKATITNSNVTTGTALDVKATSDNVINSLVFAGAAAISAGGSAGSYGGSGVFAENFIFGGSSATITLGNSNVTAGTVTVEAMDTSSIEAIAAAVSLTLSFGGLIGASVSLAASVAANTISRTITANVNEVSTASTGSLIATAGNVSVDAKDEASIRVISAAASISLSGGFGGNGAVSGAGALAYNNITNRVVSEVVGATIVANSATTLVPSGNMVSATTAPGSQIFDESGALKSAYAGAYTIARDPVTGNPITRPVIDAESGAVVGQELAYMLVTGPTTAGDPAYTASTAADAQALKEYKYTSTQVTRYLDTSTGLVVQTPNANTVEDVYTVITFEDPTTDNAGLPSVFLIDPATTGTTQPVTVIQVPELVAGTPTPQDINVRATSNANIDASIISATVSLGVGAVAGVGVSVGTSYAKNVIGSETSSNDGVFARVSGASLTASNNIIVSANMMSRIDAFVGSFSVALAGGFVGVAGAGAGAFAVNSTSYSVMTEVDNASLNAGGSVSVQARDDATIDATVASAAVAVAAGVTAYAGAVAVSTAQNSVDNTISATVNRSDVTAGNLTITASDDTEVDVEARAAAVSAAIGVGGALSGGGALAEINSTSTVLAAISGTGNADRINVAGTVKVEATNRADLDAEVQVLSVAAGAFGLAASGSVARINTRADANQNSVTANVGGVDLDANRLEVNAQSLIKTVANVEGVTVASTAAVGVSDATINTGARVGMQIGSNTGSITVGTLVAEAGSDANPAGGYLANATAKASGGGLLLGSNSTSVTVSNTDVVAATVGNGATITAGSFTMNAFSNVRQVGFSKAASVGLIGVGAAVANATSNTNVSALIGVGTDVTADTMTVSAAGFSDNDARTETGAYGLASGAAAAPRTSTTAVIRAGMADGTSTTNRGELDVAGLLRVTASQLSKVDTSVVTESYGAIAGAGAAANNTINSTVDVEFGRFAKAEAGEMDIKANNKLIRPNSSTNDIEGETGGIASGASATSDTRAQMNTTITFDADTDIDTTDPQGDLAARAFNEIAYSDKIRLETAGALSGAGAYVTFNERENGVSVPITANIIVGERADIEAKGELDFEASGKFNVYIQSYSETYGAATVALGSAHIDIQPRNTIHIKAGADLLSHRDMFLSAGTDRDLTIEDSSLEARVDNFAGSAIPIDDLETQAIYIVRNLIKVDAPTSTADPTLIESFLNIDLNADELGLASVIGMAKGTNWTTAVTDGINSLTGGTDNSTGPGEGLSDARSQIINDGLIKTGARRELELLIGETTDQNGNLILTLTGTVDPDYVAPTNYTPTFFDVDPNQFLIRVDALSREVPSSGQIQLNDAANQLLKYGVKNADGSWNLNNDFTRSYVERIERIQEQMIASGEGYRDSAGTFITSARTERVIVVDDIVAAAGRIRILTDQLSGSGTFDAPKDVTVNIVSDSTASMEFGEIYIPERNGGVDFNGVTVTSNEDIAAVRAAILAENQVSVAKDNRPLDVVPSLRFLGYVTTDSPNNLNFTSETVGTSAGSAPSIILQVTKNVRAASSLNGVALPTGDQIVTFAGEVFAPTADLQIFGPQGQNEVSVVIQANVTVAELTILVGGTIAIDVKGDIHTNGDPYGKFLNSGLIGDGTANADVLDPLLPNASIAGLSGPQGGSTSTYVNDTTGQEISTGLIANTILLRGGFVNVNGLIQAGKSDFDLTLDNTIRNKLLSISGEAVVDLGNPDFFGIYNRSLNQLTIKAMSPKGGLIDIEGRIVATSQGKLRSHAGYPHITINNLMQTNGIAGLEGIDIVLESMDVSQKGEGTIILKDKTRGVRNDGSDLALYWTRYVTDAEGQTTITNGLIDDVFWNPDGYSGVDPRDSAETLNIAAWSAADKAKYAPRNDVTVDALHSSSIGSNPSGLSGDSIVTKFGYETTSGYRYGWVVGQGTRTEIIQEKTYNSLWGIDFLIADVERMPVVDTTVLSTQLLPNSNYFYYDANPATATLDYTYNSVVVAFDPGTPERTAYNTTTTWYGKSSTFVQFTTIQNTTTNYYHTINANQIIDIEFTGNREGAFTLNAGQANIIVGGAITNQDTVSTADGPVTVMGGNTTLTSEGTITTSRVGADGLSPVVGGRNITITGLAGVGLRDYGIISPETALPYTPGDSRALNPVQLKQAAGGLVNVTSNGDILIQQKTGDLFLGQVVSNNDGLVEILTGDRGEGVIGANGGSILNGAGTNGLIKGGSIRLDADGAIGAINLNAANMAADTSGIRIDTGTGINDVVTALAANDISLMQNTGDLRVFKIKSTSGDVLVRLEGAENDLLDGNQIQEADTRSRDALLNGVWADMQLLGDADNKDGYGIASGPAGDKAREAITRLNAARVDDYRTYWDWRNLYAEDAAGLAALRAGTALISLGDEEALRTSIITQLMAADSSLVETDAGILSEAVTKALAEQALPIDATLLKAAIAAEMLVANAALTQAEADALADVGYEAYTQVSTLKTTRTAQFLEQDARYGSETAENEAEALDLMIHADPTGYLDLTTQAEKDDLIGRIKVWTEDELLSALGSGLLKPVVDTTINIEDPNLEGARVDLIVGGKVGRTEGDVTILLREGQPLSIDEQLTIAAAERSDIFFLVSEIETVGVTFSITNNSMTRTAGSWIDDEAPDQPQFRVGQTIQVQGNTANATENEQYYVIESFSADGRTMFFEQSGTTFAKSVLNVTQNEWVPVTVNVSAIVNDPRGASVPVIANISGNTISRTGGEYNFLGTNLLGGSDIQGFEVGDLILLSTTRAYTPQETLDQRPTANVNDAETLYRIAAVTADSITLVERDKVNDLDVPVSLTAETGRTITLDEFVVLSGVQVQLREDFDIEASANLNIQSVGETFVGTENQIKLGVINVQAASVDEEGQLRLKSGNGIISNVDASLTNITADSVILEGGQGSIGRLAGDTVSENRIYMELSDGSILTARTQGEIVLAERTGDFLVGTIYSASSDVDVKALAGSILDGLNNNLVNIEADNIILTATGSIGASDNDLEVEARDSDDGQLILNAGANIYVVEDGDMVINDVTSTGGAGTFVRLTSEANMFDAGVNASNIFDSAVEGYNIELIARAGLIGALSQNMRIDTNGGVLNASAQLGNIRIIEVDGETDPDDDLIIYQIGTGADFTAFITSIAGRILNGAPVGTSNITGGRAFLTANKDIGERNKRIYTNIGSLQGISTTGSAFLFNDGAIRAETEDNSAVSFSVASDFFLTATSPIDVKENIVSTNGNINIVANESVYADQAAYDAAVLEVENDYYGPRTTPAEIEAADAAKAAALAAFPQNVDDYNNNYDTVTVHAGVSVTATAGNVNIWAGDHVVIEDTALINASNDVNVYTDVATLSAVGDPVITNDPTRYDDDGGDVTIAGSVTAGRNVMIDTDAGLVAHPEGVDERDVITVTGSITAGQRIDIKTGEGSDTINLTDLELQAPVMLIDTGAGDDFIQIYENRAVTGELTLFGNTGSDRIEVVRLASHANGDKLIIDGGDNADDLMIQTWGSITAGADYRIEIASATETSPANGVDTLEVLGTTENDVFLSRANFVALLHGTEDQIIGLEAGRPVTVERIDYDRSLNGRLSLIGLAGNDVFISDDNATIMTMDGGLGDDRFQFGQIFGSQPVFGGQYDDGNGLVSNGIAQGDSIATLLTTRGYLSNGISYATTAVGGEGNDQFTVYANRGELRLEGEDGNDNFIVRAFLLDTEVLGDPGQGNVKLLAGAGDDSIQYNINAPVDIDGGAGFDTVTVLGTEGDDVFVVTEDGVFGAGLNIRISNTEEAIEVDGLEGDDTFYVQSTASGTVTNIIGGLGSDTFNISGDVNDQVYAADLQGRSAGVTHRADSDDTDYVTTLLGGLTPTVADAEQGAVVIKPTGAGTLVDENGLVDSYTVEMASDTIPSPDTVVFVTISAGIASRQDRRLDVPAMDENATLTLTGNTITRDGGSWITDGFGDWQGITLTGAGDNSGHYEIVSVSEDGRTLTVDRTFASDVYSPTGVVDGAMVTGREASTIEMRTGSGEFTDGIVLRFDSSNWGDAQTVDLRAIDDAAQEGARIVLVSHAVDSNNTAIDGAKVANLIVNVDDNDLPAVKLTESGADTFVLEGGSYTYDNPDYVEGVNPPEEATITVDTAMTDTYDVVLTRQPAELETVTVTLSDDSNSSDLLYFVDGTQVTSLTFDSTTWNQPVTVTVVAVADSTVENEERVIVTHSVTSSTGEVYADAEAAELRVTVADGDSAGLVVRETDGTTLIVDAPGEVDSYTIRLTAAPTAPVTINIIDDGQTRAVPDGDRVQEVVLINAVAIPLTFISNPDGPDTIVRTDGLSFRDQGFISGTVMDITGTANNNAPYAIGEISEDGSTITLSAGQPVVAEENVNATISVIVAQVTFDETNWFEEVTVTLEADQAFTPTALDRVTKTFDNGAHRTGEIRGPLIIDGGPTTGRELQAAIMLATESDPGPFEVTVATDELVQNDRVNIFNDDSKIADSGRMYNTADGRTQIDGLGMGTGIVTIPQGDGLPDLEFNKGISISTVEIIEVMLGREDDTFTIDGTNISSDYNNPADGVVNLPITLIHGGGGADTITVNELSIGQNGERTILALYGDTDADGRRYNYEGGASNGNAFNFNAVGAPEDHGDTIDASGAGLGADDLGVVIYGGIGNDNITGSGGRDHIAGGGGDDTIDALGGDDIIYGDNGFSIDLVTRGLVEVSFVNDMPQYLSADTRAGGRDEITGGAGRDIILGDHGLVWQVPGTLRITSTGDYARVESTDFGAGDADRIFGNGGSDIVIGGAGADYINLGSGDNIGIGDNGLVDWTMSDRDNSSIDLIRTLAPSIGSGDEIYAQDGNDVALGGAGVDTINLGDGTNVIIGDHGLITGYGSGAGMGDLELTLKTIVSTDASLGDADDITAGTDTDYIVGGVGGDTIAAVNGSTGPDVIFGDHAQIAFRVAVDGDVVPVVLAARSLFTSFGGDDVITTGSAGDIVVGGDGSDTISGTGGNDIIFGDNGYLSGFADAPVGSALISLALVQSMAATIGTRDEINIGTGAAIILGGAGDDEINTTVGGGLDAADILFGDHGRATFDRPVETTPQPIALRIESTDTGIGGADTITSGNGADIVIGGFGSDTLTGGNGDNIVFGDNGRLIGTSDEALADNGLPISLASLATIDAAIGDADIINTGLGADIILGGAGGDDIKANAGDGPAVFDKSNILLGDHGEMQFHNPVSGTNFPSLVRSIDLLEGGSDTIQSGAGNDLIIGGTAGDLIYALGGQDVIAGDHLEVTGTIDLSTLPLDNLTDEAITATSIGITGADAGGDDTIFGGAGDDFIMGQQGADTIFGGAGDDDIIGGHNVAGGADAGDALDGGAGDDVVLGDNGAILRTHNLIDTRMRVLSGTQIYGTNVHADQGDVNDGQLLVTDQAQINVDGTTQRAITLFDHEVGASASIYGDDHIAGGSEDDMIFGQLGDDVIQGDGTIDFNQDGIADAFQGAAVGAYRDAEGLLVINASMEDYNGVGRDGDDYIEGNGGADTVFGNLGRDDIIGGSSEHYGLTTREMRFDGKDMLFGGAGTDVSRNELGDDSAEAYGRDNDVIAGDNANIYRLVGINGVSSGAYLQFAYDIYGDVKIVPRGVDLLDYTEGGVDIDPVAAATDQGAADEVHGEGGDDTIYGQLGDDVLFGDAQSDDIIGGTGNDWISGGTGVDGVIGDDGRIMTSRNSTEFGESLFGIDALDAVDVLLIADDQDALRTIVDRDGLLVKSVNLTPFSTNPDNPNDQYWNATDASDIIFGGWGSDFLHGGVGSDAISGAEALPLEANPQDHLGNIISFDTPFNPGTTAAVNETEFAGVESPAVHLVFLPLLDQSLPRGAITFNAANEVTFEEGNNPFFLNFDHTEGQLDARSENGYVSDGDDRIFGSIGNDILFGGTGRDSIYGGYGNDLINGDDDLTSVGIDDPATLDVDESLIAGLNNVPDEDISYEDFIFGGAGRDFMIANTSGDRLVDWNGDFNEYFVPYRNAGAPTVIDTYALTLETFILRVAAADGVDRTRAADVDPVLVLNGIPVSVAGEPYGELGLVNNDINNPVNLDEFRKQAGPGILSGRGTVDDGVILSPDPIPVGDRLANSPLDDYGYVPTLAGVTGLYAGDETTINVPITADTGADRPTKDIISSFPTDTVGITVGQNGFAEINGMTLNGPALTYVYDDDTGEFSQVNAPTPQDTGTAKTVLQLFDSDGELFAYVDEFGGVWIIDDIEDNPNGQSDRVTDPVEEADEIEDDWLLEATVASNGVAAVAMPFRSTRDENQ